MMAQTPTCPGVLPQWNLSETKRADPMRPSGFQAAAVLALAPLLAACPADSTEPEVTVTATLTHDGFDFSANAADQDFQTNDGDVIVWQPGNQTNPSYPDDTNVWWRNDNATQSGLNETIDMGAVELSSVTQVPSQFEASPNITPLLVGHVYVATCRDGSVKFRVTATDTSNWTATVEFVFTSGTSF